MIIIIIIAGHFLDLYRLYYRFLRNIWSKTTQCDHMGRQGHKYRARTLQGQPTLSFSNPATAEERLKRTEAEVRKAVLTASANVPFAFHDQLSSAIRNSFYDSKKAAKYHSASTKAMCMFNLIIAPSLKKDLI